MQDPELANISGEKVERHVFRHEVKWGQVAVGVAVLYTVYRASRLLDRRKNQDDSVRARDN